MPHVTAAEILDRARSLYATCQTYADEGERNQVLHTEDGPEGGHVIRASFRTLFVRDGDFLFEHREDEHPVLPPGVRGAVWTKAGRTSAWSPHELPFPFDGKLETALARHAGFSDALRLLMPDCIGASPLPEPGSAIVLGFGALRGIECMRIEGRPHNRHPPVVAWIEAATGALRRVEMRDEFTVAMLKENEERAHRVMLTEAPPEHREFYLRSRERYPPSNPRPFIAESTTTWHPRFDVEIDQETFEFTPPS